MTAPSSSDKAGRGKLKQERALRDTVRKAVLILTGLESELARVGLFGTMHKVNDAKKKLGWEAAEKLPT